MTSPAPQASGAASAAGPAATNGPVVDPPSRRIRYKETPQGALHLDVFHPAGWSVNGRYPAILFFHGGGWNGGTPRQFYPHCAHLARRGMVAISAEYRIQSVHRTTPRESVLDGRSAVRWARGHAAELGIDPDRLAAGGGSAGGQVAAAAATLTGFDEPGEELAVSCRPNALVLFNPVVDNGPDGYGHERVRGYWEAFSPLHNIRAGVPPAVFFLGTEDQVVPVATGRAFQAGLQAAGARCDLFLYEGQPHGFFNFRDGQGEYYPITVAETDRFLASLGYLAGP